MLVIQAYLLLESETNPVEINIDRPKSVRATFKKLSYELRVLKQGEGTFTEEIINTSKSTDYEYETTVRLTATPEEGSDFIEWEDSGATTELNPFDIIITEPKVITAVFEYDLFNREKLYKKLGTGFYNLALYTKGGILLHPGKLARAMVDTLPDNVELLEKSQLLKWNKYKDIINCKFKNNNISAKKIIFCTNGFLKSLGIKTHYSFPLTLTASMTRKLTSNEFKSIGEPKEWGVLPVRPMGATIRMTKDKRILIRNTAEVHCPFKMKESELKKRTLNQMIGIKKRFPDLPSNIIESSWSGVVSRTRNSSQLFEKIDNNVFVAGCYNGSGIGVGTLFGEQIAIKASNEYTKEIEKIEPIKTVVPKQPFLNLGVKTRLIYERFRAKSEI